MIDYTHGMSPNMIQIAQIESQRREQGIKSYGYYEHEHHVQGIKRPEQRICQQCFDLFYTHDDVDICPKCSGRHNSGYYLSCDVCGKVVHREYKRSHTVCNECKKEQKRLWRNHNRKPGSVALKCVSCGAEIMRSRMVQNPKCEECKDEHRRELVRKKQRQYRINARKKKEA